MVQSSAQVCCGSSVCRWSLRRVAASVSLHAMSWSDAETKVGHLSPWETCKAFAFYTALEAISKQFAAGRVLQARDAFLASTADA